jgi:hypothetical protein
MMMGGRWGACLAVLALALGQSACTTMSLVETGRDGAVPAGIAPGDRISVLDTRGELVGLRVTAVGTDFIEGRAGGDATLRIRAADIRELRKQRTAPGKTAALGVGVALGLFVQALENGAVGAW